MPSESPELVAKKKFVINRDAYFSAAKDPELPWSPGNPLGAVGTSQPGRAHLVNFLYEEIDHMRFINADVGVDKVRVVLGRNWDYKIQGDLADTTEARAFSNVWRRPVLSSAPGNYSIVLQYCKNLQSVPETDYENSYYGEITKNSLGFPVITQKIILGSGWIGETSQFLGNGYVDWERFVKVGSGGTPIAGLTGGGKAPIIVPDIYFYDHFHEGINPFTPDELEKQPAGKAFFADFKTYYNERLNSTKFEKFIGSQGSIQNSLPSIYSFLRLFTNKSLMDEGLFELQPILDELQGWEYFARVLGEADDIYKNVLKKYPLESLVTLYGVIGSVLSATQRLGDSPGMVKDGVLNDDRNSGSKIIEKIVSLDFKKVDADALFSKYYDEWTALTSGTTTEVLTGIQGTTTLDRAELLKFDANNDFNRILALERIMYNLVFSADSLKILNKVEQYKKHFPFYVELNFTANLYTSIGDTMKQFFLTKFMSEVVLSSLFSPEADIGLFPHMFYNSWPLAFNVGSGNIQGFGTGKFRDFNQEKIYENLSNSAVQGPENNFSEVHDKRTIDIVPILDAWVKHGLENSEGVYRDAHGTTYEGGATAMSDELVIEDEFTFRTGDLRNYTTYFRSDYSEPININSDENLIFKKLFGSAFFAKILDTYDKKKRNWKEILDGKPAYTEDLFYRIEKAKKAINPANGEVVDHGVIQNILIPNTSELDLVKYVDTQLKYSDDNSNHVSYQYHVYAHRIVFGSKYKYQWLDGSGMEPGKGGLTVNTVSMPDPLPDLKKYFATVNAVVEPHIIILQDKIFSTPDIIIMDKPPIIPDINIIPYRAVSNRVKILITGASDRYRATPVLMLDSDEAEFEKIKKAQLSFDGKVEFGSDDPVRNFQIFRTLQKPKTYEEFELYDQISREFYEEQILPNTKYYYTFRAIDDHGHVSNPTPVYEVELIDEKGAVKPIIRLVEMEPTKNKTSVKDCQKYIYLKPTPKQIYFSDDSTVDSIFSTQEKKKKYKMRLTSKGSGKKIDINFSFKKTID